MYLSKKTIISAKSSSFVQIILGIGFGTFLLLGLVIQMVDEGKILENLIIGPIVEVPLYYLGYRGIKTNILISKAKIYNSIFMSDIDGKIIIDELSQKIGIHSYKIIQTIEKLIGRGYLVNCAISYEKAPIIVLMDDGKNLARQYEMMRCPRCGYDMKVRKGFFTTCEHCGIEIKI